MKEKLKQLLNSNQLLTARELCNRLCKENPEDVEIWHILADLNARLDDKDQVTYCRKHIVSLQPEMPTAHFNLGAHYHSQTQYDEAASCYHRTLELNPGLTEAHYNLGTLFYARGDLDAAAKCFNDALLCRPEMTEAMINMGQLLADQGKLSEAETYFNQALAREPDSSIAHYNRGVVLKQQGNMKGAIECYRNALELDPNLVDAHWNLATALLSLGDFREGWEKYEWRWSRKNTIQREFDRPMWNGSPLDDQSLLVHGYEQGLGDFIQFIRYVTLVRERYKCRTIVACPAPLMHLFSSCLGIDSLVSSQSPTPAFDKHVALLSLPHILETTLETIPAKVPYLSVPDGDYRKIRETLNGHGNKLRIGLVWAGNPEHVNDHHRSCSLSDFTLLFEIDGLSLFSLQKGIGSKELNASRYPDLVDMGPLLHDFADTAAAIMELDLVISVDTSVAHLAGALGQPVWLLLPYVAEWRWLQERDDSPWYPTMHLFRQTRIGDWQGVIERVSRLVHDLLPSEASG